MSAVSATHIRNQSRNKASVALGFNIIAEMSAVLVCASMRGVDPRFLHAVVWNSTLFFLKIASWSEVVI
jgi:hypothetical protein